MYTKKTIHTNTNITTNQDSYIGESIEQKVNRLVNNNEPISDNAPLIYTAENESNPAHDIRTDKWELAVEQMAKVHQMKNTQPNQNNKENTEQNISDNTETQMNTSD